MNNKTKNRVIFVLPVVVALVVVGVVLFFVLFGGTNGAATATETADAGEAMSASSEGMGPSCAFDFLVGLKSDVAETQIASLGRPIRVLGPDSMATQDYSAERINLMVDVDGVVQPLNCQ
jgi:hypothetical protein